MQPESGEGEMNRGVAAVLFLLGSLLGGPVIFLAASAAVVNLVRGLVLFLPNILDFGDFRFLPHALVLAVAVAVMYGINYGLMLLALRAIGVKSGDLSSADYSQPPITGTVDVTPTVGIGPQVDRGRKWLLVLFTLLVVAVVFTVWMASWLDQLPAEDVWSVITESSRQQLVFVGLTMAAFIPLTVATFAMARVCFELDASASRPPSVFVLVAMAVPVLVLVVWLAAQWLSGGLF